MYKVVRLPLKLERGNERFFYYEDKILENVEELERFLGMMQYMYDIEFAKRILFPFEIKMNNAVEGYYQDIDKIVQIINNPHLHKSKLEEDYQRVINLNRGYQYILRTRSISKETLKALYDILSKRILPEEDRLLDGHYYRHDAVYIHCSSNMAIPPKKAIEAEKVDEHMDYLFDYINSNENMDSATKEFIKSQIIHFYFVYIHPYFDVNGRTSRTLSLWHLINKGAFPLVIFNRGIPYAKTDYYATIRDAEKYRNLTYFLNYMLASTKLELEKEYVVDTINGSTPEKLTYLERQTLQYILSNHSHNTLLDFVDLYNRFNKPRSVREIDTTLLHPLLDKAILVRGKDTSKSISDEERNYFYSINPSFVDDDPEKIRRLNIRQYTQNP